MKLLTFLGTANYMETTYTLNNRGHTSSYCPAAVAHFCQPESTLVVVTRAAKAKHFKALAAEIDSFTRPIAVDIPDGHSEADLWQIFETLTRQVDEGDELVVDITNGFRSLPFLSFLAVAFLRLARGVVVRHVYYGAWEARNLETNESPIFDLTPFVTLLDWTMATDRFTRFGDASDLAALLREEIPPGPLMGSDLEARQLGNALKRAARAMEVISLALRLTRPLETMTAAENLVETLQTAGSLAEQKARPFGLLVEQVSQAYRPLALPAPLAELGLNLQIQLDMIGWYLDRGQVVQAVTLAREWLVSLLVYHFKAGSLVDNKQVREAIEFTLSNEAERLKDKPRPPRETQYDAPLQTMANHKEIGQLWGELTQLRNDIAHVGMQPKPRSAESLRKNAVVLYPRLERLGEVILGFGS